MIDYLDNDVAYLIGLIIGRGTIIVKNGVFKIIITFSFRSTVMDGEDQFSGFLKSIISKIKPRLNDLLGFNVDVSTNDITKDVNIEIRLPENSLIVRNLKLILNNNINYENFEIPSVIRNNDNVEIILEFLRGFSDVSGSIRKSNRDMNNLNRVFLDVLNKNWTLPVQICSILRNKLKIKVSNILWGHPNLRKDNAFREHQIRIYAHDFLKVGFYIDFKQNRLEELAEENERILNYSKPSLLYCKGYVKKQRQKESHILENDKRLPNIIRGKHFDNYCEICAEFGCELSYKKLK